MTNDITEEKRNYFNAPFTDEYITWHKDGAKIGLLS